MENRNSQQRTLSRRSLIRKTLQILSMSTIAGIIPIVKSANEVKRSTNLPKKATQRDFITKAFEMKEIAIDTGDQSYGAIVVKQGKVIGFGPSRVLINHDPTAHAEIEAIRDACRKLKTNDLSGCELYSTSKPCRMCETAGYWANISKYYYGADIVNGGSPNYSSC